MNMCTSQRAAVRRDHLDFTYSPLDSYCDKNFIRKKKNQIAFAEHPNPYRSSIYVRYHHHFNQLLLLFFSFFFSIDFCIYISGNKSTIFAFKFNLKLILSVCKCLVGVPLFINGLSNKKENNNDMVKQAMTNTKRSL